MLSHVLLLVWLVGLVVVWIFTIVAYTKEPTSHGQDIIVPCGCLLGILWPLYVAWIILISPLILYQWLRGDFRGE